MASVVPCQDQAGREGDVSGAHYSDITVMKSKSLPLAHFGRGGRGRLGGGPGQGGSCEGRWAGMVKSAIICNVVCGIDRDG